MEFVRDHILIASNAPYGEIKFWDFRYLRKGVPKQVGTSSIEMGTQAPSSLCTDSTGTRLFANYSDNQYLELILVFMSIIHSILQVHQSTSSQRKDSDAIHSF